MVSRLLLALALAQAVCSGADEAKLSLSLEPNTAGAARTPSIVGLNAGHRAVTDPTWPAFAQHMGGNGMRVFAMTGFGNLKAKSGLSVLAVLNSYLGSSPEQLAPDGQPYNQACILGLPTFTNYWGRTTTCSEGGGPYWGRDQRGVPVSNVDDWQAAVALIRSWAGHDPAQASSFAYPPPWWMLDFNQNDPSKADPTTGSTAATIAGLEAALGIRPLAVLHQGCGTYAFSSIDPSSSVYWGEHWEVYKVAYVDARWLWSKGVVAQELANEPDLAKYNACVNPNNTDVIARAAQLGVNSTQYVDMYWIDYISLRTRATQDAYEDANADVAAGLIPCPACRGCACPLKPVIYAHGWSRNVLMQKSGNLQGAVLTNQHWRFPASTSPNWSPTHTTPTFPWGSDSGYDAFNIWSYHSYQRTPPSLRDQVNLIVADSANPGGDTQYTPGGVLTPMPVAITELGPELAVTYGQQGDSSDTIYQAARAASQLVTMAQYGYEVYMYKFSMQKAASSTSEVTYLQKSGMTWADMSDEGTRSVGDVTSTGKAMALTLPYLFGSKPLLSCAFSTGADEGMNPCVVVRDGDVVHIFLVNDCKDASRAAAGAPGETTCADRSFTIPAAALGADPSSCISVTELSIPAGQCVERSSGSKGVVSRGTFPCTPGEVAVTTATPAAGYFGEVSAYAPLSHLPPDGLRYTLPVFSTARITIPLKQQELSARPASQGYTLYAGSKPGAPPSSLQVGISQTEVHDETAVALLQFDLSSGLAAANLALLELTVQAAPYERVVLNVIGVDPSAPPAWDASTLTWDAAGWLLTHAPAGLVRGINDNFVRLGPAGGSGGNQLVGHLSLAPSDAPGTLKQLDITRLIADAMRARACSVTLAVVRRVRRNLASPASPFGDVIPADDLAGGLATFYGREAAPEQAPQLRVSSDKDAPAYTCQPRVEEEVEAFATCFPSRRDSFTNRSCLCTSRNSFMDSAAMRPSAVPVLQLTISSGTG